MNTKSARGKSHFPGTWPEQGAGPVHTVYRAAPCLAEVFAGYAFQLRAPRSFRTAVLQAVSANVLRRSQGSPICAIQLLSLATRRKEAGAPGIALTSKKQMTNLLAVTILSSSSIDAAGFSGTLSQAGFSQEYAESSAQPVC